MGGQVANGRGRERRISNRARRRIEESRASRRRQLLAFGALGLVLVAVIAAVAVATNGSGEGKPRTLLPAVVAAEPLDASLPRQGRVLGDPNAPVTIVEWADFQCPYCGSFNKQVIPLLIEDFIKTGQVKMEFRDLPFIDNAVAYGESDMAAEAAACAADQGKYMEYHETIFANQFGENQGAYSKDRLLRMAELVGLDMDQFGSCFEDRTHKDEIRAMEEEAVAAGINSTPTLVINGRIVRYTGKYEELRAEIEKAIAEAS